MSDCWPAMKLVLRSLVVLALAVVGLLLWLRPGDTDATAAASHSSPAALDSTPAPAAASTPVDGPPAADNESARADASSRSERPSERAAPAARRTATLRVRALSTDTGAPLVGWIVVAFALPRQDGPSPEIVHRHRAALGQGALTDDEGRVELEVEPGKAHQVSSYGSPGEFRKDVSVEVPALEPGAVLDVELRAASEPDHVFFGRVVDAQSRAPLAGASVVLEGERGMAERARQRVSTDSDGVFELRFRSWSDRFVRIDAAGHAWTVVTLDTTHPTRAEALEIALDAAATLEVLVLDGARPLADASVTLTTDSYRMQSSSGAQSFYFADDPRWSATSAADGKARVEELPPDVPLELSVSARERSTTQAESISLARGEVRRIEVRLGAGAWIRGRVETSAGAPLAGVEIWRVVAGMEQRHLFESYETAVATTRSDAAGRFEFRDVARGLWWVGVAPAKSGRPVGASSASAGLAPIAELVNVQGDGETIDVVVRADAGLYLRGRVLDPAGAATQAAVMALAVEADLSLFEGTSEDGEFSLGPLPAGAYRLTAMVLGAPDSAQTPAGAPSEELVAEAGASDIVLRLQPGATIPLRVFGPDGQPAAASVGIGQRGVLYGFRMGGTVEGRYQFSGLAPGTYAVSASSADGLFAMRAGIRVSAGETAPEVELHLERGATLRVRYEGPRSAQSYGVYVNGDLVSTDGFERGAVGTLSAPAGNVEVRRMAPESETSEVLRLTLQPGEVREIVVGK